jgi:uncharacterized membrane protein AbrB (regulator of aidB expression)
MTKTYSSQPSMESQEEQNALTGGSVVAKLRPDEVTSLKRIVIVLVVLVIALFIVMALVVVCFFATIGDVRRELDATRDSW